ncbi:uncharacterized protein DNG_04904 [Cephalotrichum gorgonifer]|uniref:BHLH domain-containing protein n=1 Tax=Cephalotrichum gorgonifer TaxID=2041049 RepID=A0AAE8MX14_9PEZI|nr:uncharacterized protein DNG_04904 [Cephalotrichum gorgonifer]
MSASEDTHSNSQAEEKNRLTEVEKRNNHVASEKKRREAIRYAFDRLTTLVPGLEGQGRSEGVVLQRTAEFLHEQLGENQRLADELARRGADVPEHLKMYKTQASRSDGGETYESTKRRNSANGKAGR